MSSLPRAPSAQAKILSLPALARRVARARASRRTVVFTNGCFDLVHAGHVKLLEWAKRQGDLLIVAVNSDRSVRVLSKGPGRPLMHERDRALLVAALGCVDAVTIFSDPTPRRLIERLIPDVLVKGADWGAEEIVGAGVVKRHGGRIVRVPLLKGYSTTGLIERIRRG